METSFFSSLHLVGFSVGGPMYSLNRIVAVQECDATVDAILMQLG